MPYKKGPKNTLRYYDSSNGRYAPSTTQFLFPIPHREKKSKSIEEIEKEKKELLYIKAKKTKDKYLYDLFLEIEKNFPGEIKLINSCIYHKKIKKTREIDLVTKKFIIEVKSGKVRHKSSQLTEQINLARDINKKHLLFAPDIGDTKYKELTNKGIIVYRKKEDLMEEFKKWEI